MTPIELGGISKSAMEKQVLEKQTDRPSKVLELRFFGVLGETFVFILNGDFSRDFRPLSLTYKRSRSKTYSAGLSAS
jgi:hypothetical protein